MMLLETISYVMTQQTLGYVAQKMAALPSLSVTEKKL